MKERIANKSTLTWREEVLAENKDEPEPDDATSCDQNRRQFNHAVLDARDINSNGDN